MAAVGFVAVGAEVHGTMATAVLSAVQQRPRHSNSSRPSRDRKCPRTVSATGSPRLLWPIGLEVVTAVPRQLRGHAVDHAVGARKERLDVTMGDGRTVVAGLQALRLPIAIRVSDDEGSTRHGLAPTDSLDNPLL